MTPSPLDPLLAEDAAAKHKIRTSHDPDEAHAPAWLTAVNMVGIVLWPLGAPYPFGKTGWGLGLCAFMFVSAGSLTATWLMGDLCIRRPHLKSYPDLGREAFGEVGAVLTEVVQTTGFFFFGVFNLVMLGEFGTALFPDSDLCQQEWILITALVIAAPSQLRTWEQLAWLGFAFLAATLATLGFMVDESLLGKYCNVSYSTLSFSGVVQGLSAFAFIFSGSGMFPELIQEMEAPADFLKPWSGALWLAYAVIAPSVLVAGVVGFWAFGNAANSNVIENWPHNTGRAVVLVLNLFVLVYFTLEGNQVVLGPQRNSGLPNVLCGADEWHKPYLWPSGGLLSVGMVRTLVRCGVLTLEVLVAELLFSAGVGDLQSLSGAAAGIPQTLVLPVLFHLKVFPRDGWMFWALVGFVVVGSVLCVVGTSVAVMEIVLSADQYTVFGGSCHYTLSSEGKHCSVL